MNVRIEKDIIIPARSNPEARRFCWTINPSYTSRDGLGMIMTKRERISSGNDRRRQQSGTLQRMMSEDNGATWTAHGPVVSGGSYAAEHQNLAWHHFLDPLNEQLLSVHQTTRPNTAGSVKKTALYYQVSADAGRTWGPARQIIHRGSESDEIHWMPVITGNKQYVEIDQAPFVKLDDGTIVFGFTVHRSTRKFPAEQIYAGVAFLRGRWSDDQREIAWDAGDMIRVPADVSPYGVCEPDMLRLGGQRLLTTMRCQGYDEQNIFSTRQWAISEDGARTWSDPKTLCYDDGSTVAVPASLAAFERDPRTGKAYWFANILDQPVTHQSPRYPLTIAELDTERICIIRDSVTVVQDLPEGAPTDRCYTNFGHYVDRATGDFVLMMAEFPKFSTEDCRADSVRFRIHVGDANA